MTGLEQPPRAAAASATAPRGLAALLSTTFLAFLNFAGLLAVVPLWASTGGLGSAGVGSTTAVMMAATVATQLSARWLFRLLSLRAMMIAGAALLGVPTPLYMLSADVAPILALTAVRGVGFALMVVAGAILVADVAGEGRLARAVSYYGVAGALPNVVALGGGVWAAEAWGFAAVFAVTGAAGVLGAILACTLPRGSLATFTTATRQDVRRLAPVIVLFAATTAAFGAASTFLPLSGPDATLAALALLVASAAIVLGRLVAGAIADRMGSGSLLAPSGAAVAIGMVVAGLSLAGPPWALLLGCALIGAGFGACQNDSFVVTLGVFGPERRGTASTVWNVAYDGGVGIGAFGLGWIIGQLGHGAAFAVLGGAIALVTVLCMRRTGRRLEGPRRAETSAD